MMTKILLLYLKQKTLRAENGGMLDIQNNLVQLCHTFE